MSNNKEQETQKKTVLELPENNAVQPWYKWNVSKGKYMLGLLIAISAFGVYMQRPSVELNMDARGVGAYVRCSGSMNGDSIDIGSCRTYFEAYLPVRIKKTNNLPRIVPIEMIANTYKLANEMIIDQGKVPLKPLGEMTQGKIIIAKDGSVIANPVKDVTADNLLKENTKTTVVANK
ncbi:hypothetical protein GLP21_12180 [Photobacterium carnosum]|uniref:Uncharacterized protein n=1 Tax=Photobacterium carnosum TaxID=2023717 RepID=A0A2N4UW26_9GAMM|nr:MULTISPECIES: hypothetical protein [Photobacterium]MCD9475823.1 hypothetical protein [Photobacterium phosphoreum]MCD9485874.1 hypothetical protein [Photobacterium iliopiscarium]MCD9507685.1 hypothetical protein [Photobacterium phosphoreum]MCD9538194.1 hypothetical protein [Photobacterium carnosum]MCD9542998.1 hypothetical protein [Photobacterium carnosum]